MRASAVAMMCLMWVGCAAGEFPPSAPDDAKSRSLLGTGKSDLWRFWASGAGAGQGTPIPHALKHFNGSTSVEVPVPAIFTENSCGMPQELVAAESGRLWLASTYLWACGQGADAPASRIILGTVSRDGTWVDRSAYLPKVTPPASYDRVELFGGFGVVTMKVRSTDAVGARSVRYYRLAETGATSLAPVSDDGFFSFLDASHIYFRDGNALTHQLVGDQLVALPAPIDFPPGLLSRGGSEVWVWNANDVVQQEQNRVAYRFDGTAFQKVSFTIEEVDATYTWQAIALVPRGNGKATLLGNRTANDLLAHSTHALTARQLDGTKLTGDTVVFGPVDCATGTTDSGEACSRIKAGPYKLLDDGTIVVTASSYVDAQYTLSLIDPEKVPR